MGGAITTDEQLFAWMRERAPSAGEITVYDDLFRGQVVVTLEAATETDRKHLENAIGLRFPHVRASVMTTDRRS